MGCKVKGKLEIEVESNGDVNVNGSQGTCVTDGNGNQGTCFTDDQQETHNDGDDNYLVSLVNGLSPWHAKGTMSLVPQPNKEINHFQNVVVDVDVEEPLPERHQGLVRQ